MTLAVISVLAAALCAMSVMLVWERRKKKSTKDLWKSSQEELVVADLDKLISDPIPFKWDGRIHYIKPLTTIEFMKSSEAFARLADLSEKKVKKLSDVIDSYADLFVSVCDTIDKKEVLKMSQAQIGALYQLIIDATRGRAQVEKKKETSQIQQSPQEASK